MISRRLATLVNALLFLYLTSFVAAEDLAAEALSAEDLVAEDLFAEDLVTEGPSSLRGARKHSVKDAKSSQGNFYVLPTTDTSTVSGSPVTGLYTKKVEAYKVEIEWNWGTGAIAGYYILRNGAAIAAVKDKKYKDENVQSGTRYTYFVQSYDSTGAVLGSSASILITTTDITPPSNPPNLQTSYIGENLLTLEWDDSIDDLGVKGYNIYRNDAFLKGGITDTSYVDSGLQPLTTYRYSVRAFDDYNNVSGPTTIQVRTVDKTPPSKPSNLQAHSVGEHQVSLQWAASTDNVRVSSYSIFRDDQKIVEGVTGTSYTDTGLDLLKTYRYYVRATDGYNASENSDSIEVTTIDRTRPNKPSNLKLVDVSGSHTTFQWTASSDNVGITGYRIYRDNIMIYTVTDTIYRDSGAAHSTTYSYYVKAFDAAGNESEGSEILEITTSDGTPPSKPTHLRLGA
eukprot:2220029-Ditylum_brightwellii.AAC.1